jgi:hypothetical protein
VRLFAMFKSLPSFKVKSLPQAIGLPFLSTQEDAQLKFRSGEGGIKRLYGDEVGWVFGGDGTLPYHLLAT